MTDIRTSTLRDSSPKPEQLLMYDRANENAWYLTTEYVDLSDPAAVGPDPPQPEDIDR